MIFVNSEADIRAFIPNVFKAAVGELDIYTKITGQILEAEKFVIDKVVSISDFETVSEQSPELAAHLRGLVVCHAVHLALPALDMVITPNGTAVVSTQTLAPASKDRVAALIKSMIRMRDSFMTSALMLLGKHEAWRKSPQGLKWHRTLFHDLDFTRRFCDGAAVYAKFMELEPLIAEKEMFMAMNFFSPELMNALRMEPEGEDNRGRLIRLIKNIIFTLISGESVSQQRFMDVVQFIRANPDSFPEWHRSPVSKLFQSTGFVNTASSGGYWF